MSNPPVVPSPRPRPIVQGEKLRGAETLGDERGKVMLNHPHCAKFCVLGGASCSA